MSYTFMNHVITVACLIAVLASILGDASAQDAIPYPTLS
jgi:hypothetical protein